MLLLRGFEKSDRIFSLPFLLVKVKGTQNCFGVSLVGLQCVKYEVTGHLWTVKFTFDIQIFFELGEKIDKDLRTENVIGLICLNNNNNAGTEILTCIVFQTLSSECLCVTNQLRKNFLMLSYSLANNMAERLKKPHELNKSIQIHIMF